MHSIFFTPSMMLIAIVILIFHISFGSASSPQYTPSSQLSKREHQLIKRGDNSFSGRATFYSTGLGACNVTNTDSDFIVALNAPQYNANKWCGKKIKITFGGKSTTATIQDECPGCPYGALDLSPSLFKFFASEDAGVFYAKWSLDDGDSDSPPPPPKNDPPPPPPPPKNDPPPPQYQPNDQSTPSKVIDSPPPYKQTDHPSGLQNKTSSSFNGNLQSQSGNTTSTNQKLSSTSTTNQVDFAVPSGNHQSITLTSSQSHDPFASGQNLDAINQLVVSFGLLAAASADNALNQPT